MITNILEAPTKNRKGSEASQRAGTLKLLQRIPAYMLAG